MKDSHELWFPDNSKIEITTDPLNHFHTGWPSFKSEIMQACGAIPIWAIEWATVRMTDSMEITLADFLGKAYKFGMYPMSGTIAEDGVYLYPEDPPLYPLLKMNFVEPTNSKMHHVEKEHSSNKVMLYQYLHAIVAIIEKGNTLVVRMD